MSNKIKILRFKIICIYQNGELSFISYKNKNKNNETKTIDKINLKQKIYIKILRIKIITKLF